MASKTERERRSERAAERAAEKLGGPAWDGRHDTTCRYCGNELRSGDAVYADDPAYHAPGCAWIEAL